METELGNLYFILKGGGEYSFSPTYVVTELGNQALTQYPQRKLSDHPVSQNWYKLNNISSLPILCFSHYSNMLFLHLGDY